MPLRRRLKQERQVVSHFDEALAVIDSEKRDAYVKSLNLDDLGDLAELELQPSVYTVKPLSPEGEDWAMTMSAAALWRIFATHVVDITNCPFDLERDNDGFLRDKMRAEFPPEIVANVATIIVQLANRGNSEVFFMPPVGAGRFWLEAKLHHASETMADRMRAVASLAAVPNKRPKPDESKSKEVGATGTDGPKSTE
jgi:hypothetical protein